MDGHVDPRAPRLLRWLARLLIRGPDACFTLNDLDELVARDLERGMSRRRALLRYGWNLLGSAWSTWRTREGRPALPGISWLDVKLGARTLIRHPGLSLVGVFGMAVAMVIGVVSFEIISNVLNPALPVEDGERVVSLGYWDAETNLAERHLLYDYVTWREALTSVEPLAAFRDVTRNLAIGEGPAAPVRGVEMTASGFRVLRTPPLLGRTLVPADDREGAPRVVVIGYAVWQSRFAGASDVVGRTVRLGATPHTVVGVMPEGFEFPMRHRFWAPLRADPADAAWGEGPALYVFGRLAAGFRLEEARAELTTIGQRTAAAHPETHGQLRARILPYTLDLFDLENPGSFWLLRFGQLLASLLLVVVCVNVAVLVYARTVARRGEIAVRSALGASRRRVVMQLFVEALMLSALAAVVGLGVAQAALGKIEAVVASVESVPYWIDLDLSAATVLYALGLAVLAAIIVGVLPALKATGGNLGSSLRALSGGVGARMSGTWNVLIVAQVAIAVFLLPMAALIVWETRPRFADPGFPVDEILTAEVELNAQRSAGGDAEADPGELRARREARQTELMRRLAAEPGVAAVTFSSRFPGIGPKGEVELEGATATSEAPADPDAGYLRVGTGFFDAYGAELLTGRTFDAGDAGDTATPVVVNRSFVRKFVGSGGALGRRIRYTRMQRNLPLPEPKGTWYEIVGVVSDFPAYSPYGSERPATVYHPAAPGELARARLSLRVEGAAPVRFIGRVREVATRLDPTLRVDEIRPLTTVYGDERFGVLMLGGTFALTTPSVLLLSGAGIYALMSFAVAQRTREIGIRSALGGPRRRVLASIFARALRQLTIGAAIGLLLGGGLIASSGLDPGQATVLLIAAPAILLATGLLAALGPARRALRIQPTEALRAE